MPEKKDGTIEEGVRQEIKTAVGALIREERRRGGHTVNRVAKRLGISRVALTQIENGTSNVNAVQLWILACSLGCEMKDLFPSLASGFALNKLNKTDLEKLRKKDERAPHWAGVLFTD